MMSDWEFWLGYTPPRKTVTEDLGDGEIYFTHLKPLRRSSQQRGKPVRLAYPIWKPQRPPTLF